MAKNPVGHARTKHIDIRYPFVHEGVQNGAIVLKYIATDEMIVDMLTKPLPKHRFEKLVTELVKSGSVVIMRVIFEGCYLSCNRVHRNY